MSGQGKGTVVAAESEVAPLDKPAQVARYKALVEERQAVVRSALATILSGGATMTWEVGCGHGHFLTAYAQAHPDRLCVGIDIVPERIDRANRKRDRAKLDNLYFILAEAHLFLGQLPDSVRFSDVFVLFPDPWPKARHQKHRIMQPRFLTATAARSGGATRLCFRTDYAPYFADAFATVRDHPDWVVSSDPWPFEFETVFQSRAEGYQSLVARRRVDLP